MQRWHSAREEAIMFRRWKEEMGQHRYDWRCPPIDINACHCARGKGSMRKRAPYGHHRHCLMCNCDKYLDKGRRRREYREAIEFELRAY